MVSTCPLKKPPSFEIAIHDSLEPSFKTNELAHPISCAKDASKKTKEPKPKEPKHKAIIVDDSDEDTAILEALCTRVPRSYHHLKSVLQRD